MRLHPVVLVGTMLCGGLAFAQGMPTFTDQPKTGESKDRAKKDPASHAPLFLEQKDAPAMSKTRLATAPRLYAKSKD